MVNAHRAKVVISFFLLPACYEGVTPGRSQDTDLADDGSGTTEMMDSSDGEPVASEGNADPSDTGSDTGGPSDDDTGDENGVDLCGEIDGLQTLDLALPEVAQETTEVFGSNGAGATGVPVAAGGDMNGDTFEDFAFSAMRGTVVVGDVTRAEAGEVYLILGNGSLGETLDTAVDNARILTILGATAGEHAGNAIWMDDVTGDGLADLLIGQQDANAGAGALTLIVGGPELTTFANTLAPLDLAAPPAELTIMTFTGDTAGDRLGIWMRTGDVTGDGTLDIVVGADGRDVGASTDAGAVYIVRGGAHLAASAVVDLDTFTAVANPILGHVARVTAPSDIDTTDFHFGATVQVADIDGNGKAEIFAAAALNRASGQLSGATLGTGINPNGGTLFIVGDANFVDVPDVATPGVEVWDPIPDFAFETALAGSTATITGGTTAEFTTVTFGEEILAGLDYDTDGFADIFVGDLVGNRVDDERAGLGFVIWGRAAETPLLGQTFSIATPPEGLAVSVFLGPTAGALAGDTAMHGDFNGDGRDDLAFSSPRAAPEDRVEAGVIHVFWNQDERWPALIDIELPPIRDVSVTNIFGAVGTVETNVGDTLSYSAAYRDVDGDGSTDIITNEMLGDAADGTPDIGNLVLIGGAELSCAPPA